MKEDLVLRIGDVLTDDKGRVGVIEMISIAMSPYDPAAESDTAVNVEEYHTEMGYTGAVSFGRFWCYFNQIRSVESRENADDQGVVQGENKVYWRFTDAKHRKP